MVRWGGLKLRTSKADLVTVGTALEVCKHLGLPAGTLSSLETINSTSPAAVAMAPPLATELPLPTPSSSTPARWDLAILLRTAVLAVNQPAFCVLLMLEPAWASLCITLATVLCRVNPRPPAPTPAATHAGLLFPVNLPECKVPHEDLFARYGLKEHNKPALEDGPLGAQIEAMRAWCMRPVQLDRRCKPINMRTWSNIKDGISLYLGYLFKHESVASPKLEHFMSPLQYTQFMAFLLARGTQPTHQQQQVGHARKVVEYLCSQADNPLQALQQRAQFLQWFSTLNQQLGTQGSCGQKRDVGILMEQGKWVEAKEYLVLVEKAKAKAKQELQDGSLGLDAARLLHDALLLSCMLGHLPPVRLFTLRTSTHPEYQGVCLDPACEAGEACMGNSFLWVDEARTQLKVHWSHHKNSRR